MLINIIRNANIEIDSGLLFFIPSDNFINNADTTSANTIKTTKTLKDSVNLLNIEFELFNFCK